MVATTSGGINVNDNGVRGSEVDSSEQYGKRVDPVLKLLSDLYSELDTISVGISGLLLQT